MGESSCMVIIIMLLLPSCRNLQIMIDNVKTLYVLHCSIQVCESRVLRYEIWTILQDVCIHVHDLVWYLYLVDFSTLPLVSRSLIPSVHAHDAVILRTRGAFQRILIHPIPSQTCSLLPLIETLAGTLYTALKLVCLAFTVTHYAQPAPPSEVWQITVTNKTLSFQLDLHL